MSTPRISTDLDLTTKEILITIELSTGVELRIPLPQGDAAEFISEISSSIERLQSISRED